jgi:epoxyqueuosine reductase QueG
MIKQIIENHLTPREEFIFGFADLRGLLHDRFSGYQFGISIGRKLNSGILDDIINGPTLVYYQHYNNINKELEDLTLRIHNDLLALKINSIPVKPTISLRSPDNRKYLKTLSYDISHKMVATRAGLGWIGKTDLLISERFGPRLRLVTILLDRDPGVTAIPVEESKCGKCNICVVKCPARAANGMLWNSNIHRDRFFNAVKCREKCGELAKQKLNVDERICGLCVSVCPIGRKNEEKGIPDHSHA